MSDPDRPAHSRPDLSGQTALVTGASRGIGAAAAEWLAARGAHVIAVARTTGGLEELDDRIKAAGGAATLAPMDVTEDAAMQHLCRSIHDRWGRLDIWVHAAIQPSPLAPTPQIAATDLDRVLATNVRAAGVLIAYVAPLLGLHGRAVHFDDPAPPARYAAAYAASKAAQRALFAQWHAEAARIGPRVDVVTPAPMATALRGRFYPGEDRAALERPAAEAARLLGALFAPAS